MDQIDPEFLLRSREAFRSSAPPSLKDIRDRVTASEPGARRRDTLSALDTLARAFGKDLTAIRAMPEVLRELFASKTATQLGLSTKRYANIRSCVIRAIRDHGEAPQPITKRIPLTADWASLLSLIQDHRYRFTLNRLASFCSFMRLSPNELGRDVLMGFYEALEAEEVVKHPRKILKHTIAIWNMYRRQVDGWPDIEISSPFERDVVSLPLSAFPESFQEDVRCWERRLTDPDPFDPLAPARPLRPSTVESQRALVLRFASALVHRGDLSIDALTSLADLFEIDRFKSGLRFFLDRLDGEPTAYVANMASTLLYLARNYCRVDQATNDALTAICQRLGTGRLRRMPPRDRELLRQIDDPENVAKLLSFPEEERARGLAQKNPHRAAKCFERALVVALLIYCTLRIGTLRQINMTTDISWAGGRCYLSIDGSRVKNGEALEFELPDDVAALLKEYVTEYRQRLPGSNGPYLFPGRDGGPRPYSTMKTDFEQAVLKHTGLVMHPHLMRHAIAKIVVERDPGLTLAMSRQLGHKRIDMTMAHYLGTEGRASGRQIDKVLKKAIEDPELPED